MAETAPKKRRQLRKVETVRERSAKPVKQQKTRRLHATRTKLAKPVSKAVSVAKKEYYLPMPDNKVGRFLNKRRRVIPRFFVESYQELRMVVWPNRRTTINLSIAVFLFAFFFGLIIALADYGLDKLFKILIIK